MLILLIIKEKSLLEATAKVLTPHCRTVFQTSNSTDAVHILKQNTVDLVITEVDINIDSPCRSIGIDGWRLARLVRSGVLKAKANLPIVLIAEEHSERIAESTARLFGIDKVTSYANLVNIDAISKQVLLQQETLSAPQRVLVIEDTEDTAILIERILRYKYHVELAADGPAGLKAYEQGNYDIVLLDIMLPGLSGDQVLQRIMAQNPSQTVVVMTAHGTSDLAEDLLKAGASDYIQKPFKAEQLRNVCEVAAKREDFLISNEQFSSKVKALKAEQQKYNELSSSHQHIMNSLSSIVIELSLEGRINFLNQAWETRTEYSIEESLGRSVIDFIEILVEKQQPIQEIIKDIVTGKVKQTVLEFQLKRQYSQPFWCEINLSAYNNKQRNTLSVLGTIEDISIRKDSEQQLQHLALHDSLTGLHNRFYFDNELNKIALFANRTQQQHSLLYIDLDHFKAINDSEGHLKGDLILKEVAQLLTERVRESDLLCRIGGDEFTIILTNTEVDDAVKVAKEICQSIANAVFNFDNNTYKISSSIGIAKIDGTAPSNEAYLQQADIAMFAAKERGRNRVHIYSEGEQVTDNLKHSFDWIQKLRKSVEEDNIILHFQPILDLKTRTIACYEALVRLQVDGEIIFPDRFIPSLEKANDMSLLDSHVIGKTVSLMTQYPQLEKVAINLSAQAFNDEELYDYIKNKLAQYQIKPSRIIFELTESASLSNLTGTQRMVTKLNQLGCQFSIDDFGTGFSTFSYLKQIPAESVKIDGSFVKDMIRNPTDAVLVKSIHETSKALGKETIAEFVEDQETLEKLAELGVNYAQGYCISRPVPVDVLFAC